MKLNDLSKENIYIFLIFISMSFAIVILSYLNPNGYLSPDSTNYLSVAKNLVNGNGYILGHDLRREPFAVWPVGYPTLIFIVAKITNLSVFWASKLTNIILIFGILLTIRKTFKHQSYLYALVLFFSSYILIYSYTWSETLFIFLLLAFCISIYYFVNKYNPTTSNYILIFLTTMSQFLSRYIGAFSFGIIALLGLHYLIAQKKYRISIILLSISFLCIKIMFINLYINYKLTGYPTGMPRIEAPESNFQLFYMLSKAIIAELIIPIQSLSKKAIILFIFQFFILFLLAYKHKDKINKCYLHNEYTIEKIFLTVGFFYFISIITLRWISHFDGFSYRLLAPGTFLIYISLISFLQKSYFLKNNEWMKHFLIFIALFSFIINVGYRSAGNLCNEEPYPNTIKEITKKYKKINQGSIIVFPEKHLNYLRLDLDFARPYYTPYYKNKEKWNSFIKRVNKNKNIYVNTDIELGKNRFHKSIYKEIQKMPKSELYKIK
jgi:hypothetical protein